MQPAPRSGRTLPGFDPVAAQVLHHLVGQDDADEKSVATALGLSQLELRTALDLLERDLLAVRVDQAGQGPGLDGPARWAALPPRSGLATLLARRRAELAGWEQQIDALEAEYWRASSRRPITGSVEYVSGTEQVGAVYAQLLSSARHEVLHLAKPPYVVAEVGAVRTTADDGLDAGVEMRSVYDVSGFDDPVSLWTAETGTGHGGQSRLATGVPLKLVLVDRTVALLPTRPDDASEGSVVVRTPGIVAALVALFESVWERAMPVALWGGRAPAVDVPARTRDILALLAAGLTDDAIARTLRVSRRTVQKNITDLAEALGARTRFQVALLASERGLLTR